MVKEQSTAEQAESVKQMSGEVDVLQNQLGSMLSGVEKSLAVTCESIMGKMKQLEDKIQDMEKRYEELTKDAEQALQEATSLDKAETDASAPSGEHEAAG